MATENDVQGMGNTFRWRIDNVSESWWVKQYEPICSPCFTADLLEDTKWSFRLYPIREENKKGVNISLLREKSCRGPDAIIVSYHYEFLNKYDSIVREDISFYVVFCEYEIGKFSNFAKLASLFSTDREIYLPEDVLIIQCSIWSTTEKPETFNHTFATSVFEVKWRSFKWRIDKISTLDDYIVNRFKDDLIDFDVSLNIPNSLDTVITALDKKVFYISLNIFISDSKGKRKLSDITYTPGELKQREPLYNRLLLSWEEESGLSNDTLSIDFEFVLSTIEHINSSKNISQLEKGIEAIEKSQSLSVEDLRDCFNSMYMDEIFSDMELRTPTKSFPTHKCILSAWSPVFKNMFSHDMQETDSGHVDIPHFENDTIHRMLLYMYTGSLKDLQLQSVPELYQIADKYEILKLKSRCSSLLKKNLPTINACDALILAVLYNDDDLKNSVQDYIVEQSQIFFSKDWKELMGNLPEIAADTMYRKITGNKIYL